MSLDFPEVARAPGRGRYARGESSAVRFREQRERLLRATAIAYLDGDASVTRVTALSGVGRNTFYECFDDFAHALAAVRRDEVRRVQRGLAQLAPSSEAVELLCGRWTALIADEPVSALATLGLEQGQGSSELLVAFCGALDRALPAGSPRREALLIHAAACAEISARVVALCRVSAPDSSLAALLGEGAPGQSPSRAGSVLARSIRCLVG